MALTDERLDRLLRYCEVDPADEHRVTKIRDLYPGAVAYLEGAGISEPEEGSLRRESYDLCVNALVLDSLDLPELSVGGTDNVDSGVFAPFDYVALGHLHGAQHIGRETIRYAGSPLKYSFSEARQHKSVTVVTLGEKGDVQVRTAALTPLRELREIRGSYDELTARSFYEHTTYRSDYLHLILTDEQDVFDAMSRLRTIYPYLMTLDYDNARTRAAGGMSVPAETERRTPLELFEALYQRQNHRPMSEVQRTYIAQLMEQIMEVQG